jgi:N-acetylgalactosamine-N,N'-diacetylbacillosaminyl-diphospho-undecaprenol 4-alpha-N-acetylgalactosaminyltransferase
MTRADDKTRIVFVINSLTGGGAERAMVNLLAFARDELAPHDVRLVLLDRETEQHEVDPSVHKTTLDARHRLLPSLMQLYDALRRLRPDVTVSFLTRSNCANIVASILLRRPCIISERVHTSSHFGNRLSSLGSRLMVRLLYPRADHVIAVSGNVKQDLIDNFGVPAGRISVIGNGISTDTIARRSCEAPAIELPEEFIVAAGRLVPTKNFTLLVEAYHRSGLPHPLVILGEGPERARLAAQIDEFGLGKRVLLPGYVANPYPVIKRARMFVSSSNAEGFPNALVEAMALGCPVVATDCEAGPAEILDSATRAEREPIVANYGVLVPVNAPEALAHAMRMLMEEPMRRQFSLKASRRAADYAPEQVVKRYMAVLGTMLRRTEALPKIAQSNVFLGP